MNIIITGNIGCGKSTFSKMLAALLPHYNLYDVDAEIHKLYQNEMFCASLQSRFGTADRQNVSNFVFDSPVHREWLEKLSKQYLQEDMRAEMASFDTIFDFPLYFEHDGPIMFAEHDAFVVVVNCDIETQRARIAERGRFSPEKAEAIMAEQFSGTMKVALAHMEVDSSTTLEAVMEQAKGLAGAVQMDDLETRFMNTFNSQDLWLQLHDAYSQEHRHYHGLYHLVKLFEQFDQVKPQLNDPLAVEIAIWWHDYVFNTEETLYPLNEYDSAYIMFQQMTEYRNGFLTHHQKRSAQVAAEMICATKGHVIRSPYILSRPDLLSDCQLFLDMDLSGLGLGTEADILESDEQIRQEFIQYNDFDFATARLRAMSAFGLRPNLFHSAHYAHLEEAAKANIKIILNRCQEMLVTHAREERIKETCIERRREMKYGPVTTDGDRVL